jgi:hypothetical protein
MGANYLYNLLKSQTGTTVGSKQAADMYLANADVIAGIVPYAYDFISANLAGATTDVYTYKTGGAGGTIVATVTIVYTDASKATLSSVART